MISYPKGDGLLWLLLEKHNHVLIDTRKYQEYKKYKKREVVTAMSYL